jgi:hypothetical protein
MTALYVVMFLREFMVRAALVAVLAHALVPAGWMPNPAGAASGAPIVICTGHGPLVIGPDGKPQAPVHHGGHSDVCVFAAGATHAVAAVTPPLPEQHPAQVAELAIVHHEPVAFRRPSRRQNPRGPPILA